MPALTPGGLPYPVEGDTIDSAGDLQHLAEMVDIHVGAKRVLHWYWANDVWQSLVTDQGVVVQTSPPLPIKAGRAYRVTWIQPVKLVTPFMSNACNIYVRSAPVNQYGMGRVTEPCWVGKIGSGSGQWIYLPTVTALTPIEVSIHPYGGQGGNIAGFRNPANPMAMVVEDLGVAA